VDNSLKHTQLAHSLATTDTSSNNSLILPLTD